MHISFWNGYIYSKKIVFHLSSSVIIIPILVYSEQSKLNICFAPLYASTLYSPVTVTSRLLIVTDFLESAEMPKEVKSNTSNSSRFINYPIYSEQSKSRGELL